MEIDQQETKQIKTSKKKIKRSESKVKVLESTQNAKR